MKNGSIIYSLLLFLVMVTAGALSLWRSTMLLFVLTVDRAHFIQNKGKLEALLQLGIAWSVENKEQLFIRHSLTTPCTFLLSAWPPSDNKNQTGMLTVSSVPSGIRIMARVHRENEPNHTASCFLVLSENKEKVSVKNYKL